MWFSSQILSPSINRNAQLSKHRKPSSFLFLIKWLALWLPIPFGENSFQLYYLIVYVLLSLDPLLIFILHWTLFFFSLHGRCLYFSDKLYSSLVPIIQQSHHFLQSQIRWLLSPQPDSNNLRTTYASNHFHPLEILEIY